MRILLKCHSGPGRASVAVFCGSATRSARDSCRAGAVAGTGKGFARCPVSFGANMEIHVTPARARVKSHMSWSKGIAGESGGGKEMLHYKRGVEPSVTPGRGGSKSSAPRYNVG